MVEVTTNIQEDFDTLVEAGMHSDQDPIRTTTTELGDTSTSSGIIVVNVVFLVSQEIADKYWATVV